MGSSILKQTISCLLLLLVVAMLPTLAPAQASAPSPGIDCSTALLPLLPCLDFVEGNATAPSKNCCDALPAVVNSDPVCLCALFGNNSFGITVNLTDAVSLPALCHVQTLPISTCSAVGYPVPANLTVPPVVSPSPLSPTTLTAPASSAAPVSTVTPSSSAAPTALATSPSVASISPSGAQSPPSASTPPLPASPSSSPNGAVVLSVSTAVSFVALFVASAQVLQVFN